MLKRNWRLISRLERVGDNLLIAVAFIVAYYGRGSLQYWDRYFGWQLPFGGDTLAPPSDYFVVLVIALILYNFTLSILGAYNSMRLRTSWQLLRISLLSSLFVFLGIGAGLFLLKIDLSRAFIIIFCSLIALFLAAERYLVLHFLRYWRRRGHNFRNVVISGVGPQARRLADAILARPELGIRLVGFAILRDSLSLPGKYLAELPSSKIFRGTRELEKALKEYAVDEVIFTAIVDCMAESEEMMIICSEEGVQTTIAADLFSVGMVKSEVSYFGDMPLVHYQTPPGDSWELSLKRMIDIVVSAILLVILSPLLLLLALGVKFTSAGPVLYRQDRVGLNGRIFPLYKFRSMVCDAERQLEKLREQNEMSGPVFKMSNDPRVTTFGRFLRRFSLDELPQLWNVLVGDMSLVGPRPPVPGEVMQYVRKYRRRLSMRPGLTCTWQVSGRNEIRDFDSWMKLDLDYIDNWSLLRDFKILARTVPAVLFGAGAR